MSLRLTNYNETKVAVRCPTQELKKQYTSTFRTKYGAKWKTKLRGGQGWLILKKDIDDLDKLVELIEAINYGNDNQSEDNESEHSEHSEHNSDDSDDDYTKFLRQEKREREERERERRRERERYERKENHSLDLINSRVLKLYKKVVQIEKRLDRLEH